MFLLFLSLWLAFQQPGCILLLFGFSLCSFPASHCYLPHRPSHSVVKQTPPKSHQLSAMSPRFQGQLPPMNNASNSRVLFPSRWRSAPWLGPAATCCDSELFRYPMLSPYIIKYCCCFIVSPQAPFHRFPSRPHSVSQRNQRAECHPAHLHNSSVT